MAGYARQAGMMAACALSAVIFIGLSAPGEPARAQDVVWLTDAQIEAALKGRTLDGLDASGRRFTESYLAQGDLTYTENGTTLRGRWSVRAGTLCTIYDTDPLGGCFRVTATRANCFDFYFVARTEAVTPGTNGVKPDWTARGAVEGKVDACADAMSV